MLAEHRRDEPDVAVRGVRLQLIVRAAGLTAELALDAGLCERLFRMAAYRAIRTGAIAARDPVVARLVAEESSPRHGDAFCLGHSIVELATATETVWVRFPRDAFGALAAARAIHLLAEAGTTAEAIDYALHALPADDPPLPVAVAALPEVSLAATAAGARRWGRPDEEWVATVLTPEVSAGLGAMERESRLSGLEVAARIYTSVGFDPERRAFLRTLERLVIARATRATALSVISTAASWAEVLAGAPVALRTLSAAHTHVHLAARAATTEGGSGDHLVAGGGLGTDGEPCISIEDIVTHYTAYPDPLAAAAIVSVFPDRRVITLYGYTPDGRLRVEPGYWERPTRGGL